jgi:hypothetical protein
MEWILRVMKKRNSPLIYLAVLGFALNVAWLHGQQLTIETQSGKRTVLEKSDLESLPHVKVTVTSANTPATYEGALVQAILEKAGVGFGEALRGKGMASCLLVEAADGYRVVIALPELDPAFTDKQVVLAFSRDGKPLDQKEGPYRIVIPNEKRMARWVRQVTTLKIVDVQ